MPAPDAQALRGALYVVATPLGNLADLTPRAAEVLALVDLVASEDTRRARQLLTWLGLRKRRVAVHKFGEAKALAEILAALAEGRSVALICDGGTPAISDPGQRLVAAAHRAGNRVIPVPGPCAVSAALSVSGLPSDKFLFAGFLPARTRQRLRELARLAERDETLVVFEAPHRLAASLGEAFTVLGDRPAALCRELTKVHEEVQLATLGELCRRTRDADRIRGEITLVIAGRPAAAPAPVVDAGLGAAWEQARSAEDGDARRAIRRMARDLGIPRAELRRRLRAAGLVE